jgi:hypothetical protein
MSSKSHRRQSKIQTCPFGCAARMVLASIIILTSAIDEVHAGHGQSSGMGVSAKPVGMGVSPKSVGKGISPTGGGPPPVIRQKQPPNLGFSPPGRGPPLTLKQEQPPGMGNSTMGGGVPMSGAPTGGTPMSSSCVTGQLVCPIWQPLHSQCRCPDNFGNYHSGQAQ